MQRRRTPWLAWTLLLACARGPTPQEPASATPPAEPARDGWSARATPAFSIEYTAADAGRVDALLRDLEAGRERVEGRFAAPFPRVFVVRVFPSRAALTEHWRRAWKLPALETECWMVASGTADEPSVLSPGVWATEACEHDPDDAERTRLLLAHEPVHVYHGQHNARGDFDGLDAIGWFCEGLAVVVSGQLDHGHLAEASEALAVGAGPAQLEEAWSGKYRYGVSGSLVRHLEALAGGDVLRSLLAAQTEEELLAPTGLTEAAFLESWRAAVEREPGVINRNE